MDIQKIKRIRNPYKPYAKTNLPNGQFIGRTDELEQLEYSIDDYIKMQEMTDNYMIIGEKSVGKSTLLSEYKKKLSGNFEIYSITLSSEPKTLENINLFFEDIFHEIFMGYEDEMLDEDVDFFSHEFHEVWFKYRSGKDISKEKQPILLNIQKYTERQAISDSDLKRDFDRLISELNSLENTKLGLVLIIDEFQFFENNIQILEKLNFLTEKIKNMMVVGAGLPVITQKINIFDKFNRSAMTTNLRGLNKYEIQNACLQPLSSKLLINNHESRKIFDSESFEAIQERTNGNPYHVKILCGEMWEYFRRSNSEKMEINDSVMNSVMIQYDAISDKSKKIRRYLNDFDEDELNIFSRLYMLCGLSIRNIIYIVNAFNHLSDEKKQETIKIFVNDFSTVSDSGLFYLRDVDKDVNISHDVLSNMSFSNSSSLSLHFTGNHMDALYAFYYFRKRTNKELISIVENERDFKELLVGKLSREVINNFKIFCKKEIKVDSKLLPDHSFTSYTKTEDTFSMVNQINEIKTLCLKEDYSKEEGQKMEQYASNEYFKYLTLFHSAFNSSYLSINIDLTVRGEHRSLFQLFPVDPDTKVFYDFEKVKEYEKFISASIHEYGIKINDFSIRIIPNYIPEKLIFVVVHDLNIDLVNLTARRNFKAAKAVAKAIHLSKINKKKKTVEIIALNNFAFTYLCLEDNDEAINLLKAITTDATFTYTTLFLNIGYAYYLKKDYKKALIMYKKTFKKSRRDDMNDDLRFIHLCLPSSKVKPENKIIENVKTKNASIWNIILITAQMDSSNQESITSINSYKKKLKISNDNDRIIAGRVDVWLNHLLNKNESVQTEVQNLLDKIKEDELEYILNDIIQDEIFFKSN